MIDEINGMCEAELFFEKYWQRKPVVMRKAVNSTANRITADVLAGLACCEGSAARLVWEKKDDRHWSVDEGPFGAEQLEGLPDDGSWSLLVRHVDRMWKPVAELKQAFSFIPNWRLDDVMVSFAGKGGGVGPHYDLYDVFLVSGQGRRLWLLSDSPLKDAELLGDCDMKILAKPELPVSFELSEGDVLYVPPYWGHHGVSLEASITYSVGFRAPSYKQLLQDYMSDRWELFEESELFVDQDSWSPSSSGLLEDEVVEKIRSHLIERLFDPSFFKSWLAEQLSSPISEAEPVEVESESLDQPVYRHLEGARYLYVKDGDWCHLFVDGHKWSIPVSYEQQIEQLCRRTNWTKKQVVDTFSQPVLRSLWGELMEHGLMVTEGM